MKEQTVKNLRKLAEITGDKCSSCVTMSPTRCCDAFFCSLAKKEMDALGVSIPEVPGSELPYMGPLGCVVPPEYRPGCTGFVCPPHLSDDKFKSEYLDLLDEVRKDPQIRRVMKETTGLCKKIVNENSAFIKQALEQFG